MFLVRTVAEEAFRRQDGTDVATKINLFRTGGKARCSREEKTQINDCSHYDKPIIYVSCVGQQGARFFDGAGENVDREGSGVRLCRRSEKAGRGVVKRGKTGQGRVTMSHSIPRESEEFDPPPKRSWRMFRKVGLGACILIGVAGTAISIFAYWPDVPLQDDSDLLPLAEKIKAGENNPAAKLEAVSSWELDSVQRSSLQVDSSKRTGEDWENVAQLIREKDSYLALLRESAEVPGWKHHVEYRIDFDLSHLNALRQGTMLWRAKVEILLRGGRTEEAIEEALGILKLGKRIEEGGGTLIHKLVALAAGRSGLKVLHQILETQPVESAELIAIADEVEKTKLNPRDFADAFRVEYQMHKNIYGDLDAGRLSTSDLRSFESANRNEKGTSPAFFQKNKTINQLGDALRLAIVDAEGIPGEQVYQKQAIDPLIEKKANMYRLLVSPNAVGNIMLSVSLPAYHKMSHGHAHSRASRELLLVYIAAQRFRNDETRSVGSLGELVPKYLDRIPEDPFDGNPIRFNPETRRVYSVGSDFKDEQGSYQPPAHRFSRPRKDLIDIREEPALEIP